LLRSLPSDACSRFERDGYYIANDRVPAHNIDAFLEDLSDILSAQLERANLSAPLSPDPVEAIYAKLTALHRFDQGVYLATLRVLNKLKSLYDLFLADGIAQACADLGVRLPLMHTLPLFHIMSNRLAIDQGYHGFAPHQDWSGLQTSLNTVVIWLGLHDIDERRFPLEVLPHSHLQGLCASTFDGSEHTLDEWCVARHAFVPISVRKGDVVLMSPFTIHRTGPCDSEALRLAVSWRYEDALEPTFVARKYPFAQTRVVNHALQEPGFPDSGQMRAVFAAAGSAGDGDGA
jgi:hypothetical protein